MGCLGGPSNRDDVISLIGDLSKYGQRHNLPTALRLSSSPLSASPLPIYLFRPSPLLRPSPQPTATFDGQPYIHFNNSGFKIIRESLQNCRPEQFVLDVQSKTIVTRTDTLIFSWRWISLVQAHRVCNRLSMQQGQACDYWGGEGEGALSPWSDFFFGRGTTAPCPLCSQAPANEYTDRQVQTQQRNQNQINKFTSRQTSRSSDIW